MKSDTQIVEYINSHKIAGRYERMLIRDYIMNNHPGVKNSIHFFMPRIESGDEITFADFLEFVMDIRNLYDKLLNSGMFWEIYPQLTGEYEKDKQEFIMTERKTHSSI